MQKHAVSLLYLPFSTTTNNRVGKASWNLIKKIVRGDVVGALTTSGKILEKEYWDEVTFAMIIL